MTSSNTYIKNILYKYYYFLLGILFFISCNSSPQKKKGAEAGVEKINEIPELNFVIQHKIPHDTSAFTEGFLIHNGIFYESTGSPENMPFTKSIIGIIDTTTGILQKKIEINKEKYFGEGMVILKNKIYQLTYQNQLGFVYDLKSFKKIKDFYFKSKEGWGLSTDGEYLIMSDGTNQLTFIDPETFTEVKTIKVYRNGFEEIYLNELEFINGYIYANVWLKNYIVKISPLNGEVLAIINLEGLMADALNEHPNAEVLNGIAYDKEKDKIYVTGKLWKSIYQINFEH